MASLSGRVNGLKVSPNKYTYGKIIINRNGRLYWKYKRLRSDSKVVLDSILTYMTSDMNQIIVSGDILQAIIKDSGLSEKTIKNRVSEMDKIGLLMKTKQLPYEYIIHPNFAVKGSLVEVLKFCQSTEYKQKIPMGIHIFPDEEFIKDLWH